MFDSLTQGLGSAMRRFFGPGKLTEKNIDEGIRAVRTALLEADVRFEVVRDFIKRVKARALGDEVLREVEPSQQIIKIISDELTALLGGSPGAEEGEGAGNRQAVIHFASRPPTVVMLVGLQGSGKTTTCAKLGAFLKSKGRRPMLVAADVQRPAAIEQLRVLGRQIGVEVHSEEGGRPPGICKRGLARARKESFDTIILDTAGRLHIDAELMAELREIERVIQPHEVFFVCDAMTGQDAVTSAREFNEQLEISGVILTKLDGDTRGGAAMSIRAVTGKAIRFTGVGEKIADLEPFFPERMASRILGMGDVVTLVEKAQEVIDEKEAEKQAQKLLKGSFNLDDMYGQLRMFKRMGPMKKILGMLPGMGEIKGMMDQVDDRDFSRMEAIFTSMTPWERRHPDRIDQSRRHRIARGSGNPVARINDLMKSFRQMQRMMKMMRGGGMREMMKSMGGGRGARRGGALPGMPGGFPGGLGGRGRGKGRRRR